MKCSWWRSCAVLLALVLASATPAVAAAPRIPYGGEFLEQIDAVFFPAGAEAGALPDPGRIEAYRAYVRKKLRVLENHFVNADTIDKGKSRKKARKDFQESDLTIALEYILRLLDRMLATTDPAEAYDLAAEVLQLEFATRSYTDPIGSVAIPIFLRNLVFEWRIENSSRAREAHREAHNLVNPVTGEFYRPKELAALIRSGFDISTLQPPSRTRFWRAKDDISQVDIARNYLEGGDPIHEGIRSVFPPGDGAVFDFKKSHMTQSKPKLDVYWLDEACRAQSPGKQKKCRKTLKLKFGMETHADPTGNALLSSLGYNADISMHLNDVRIYLGDYSFEQLEKDWHGYFDRQRMHTYIPLKSVLKEGEAGHGIDERGEWIEFHDAVTELKPKEFVRIGLWPFSWGMAASAREARALFLFNTWIANADMKDEENNKLILRKAGDGEWRSYLVQQDIGHSLGLILPERANAYPWDLVESGWFSRLFAKANRSIELNYIDLQEAGLEDTTTYADAKWMARMIAQLTREQIQDAVALGRWPDPVARLYVEKLINRRNQLVQAFGLEDEHPLLPVDRHLTTEDGAVVDGRLEKGVYDSSPIRYDEHWDVAMRPIYAYLGDLAKRAIQTGVGAIDVINPGSVEIEGNVAVFPKILLKLSRQVLLNPNPTGAGDQYIVMDTLMLGLRVGVGWVGNLEVSALRRYQLAYPVSTWEEGIGSLARVVNVVLPYQAATGKLPERYVLLREDAVKGGIRVTSEQAAFYLSPFGAEVDQNYVVARRSVIDRRDRDPIVWIDKPRYWEWNARMFVEAWVLQIPFVLGSAKVGSLEGTAYVLDADKLDTKDEKGRVIFDRMVRHTFSSGIEKLAKEPPRRARSDFKGRGLALNLIFLRSRSRVSEQKVTLKDADGEALRQERQFARQDFLSWFFLDNGERQQFTVEGFMSGPPGGDELLRDPVITANFYVDDLNAHSDEFDHYYRLLRELGAGESDLAPEFSAQDWEVTGKRGGRWTRLLVDGTVRFYEGAIDELLRMDEVGFWRRLARQLDVSESDMLRFADAMRPGRSKRLLFEQRRIPNGRVRSVVQRARGTLRTVRLAGQAEGRVKQVRLLVKALYGTRFKAGGTFDPIVLTSMMEESGVAALLDDEQMAIEVRVGKAFEDESNLPDRRDVVSWLGARTKPEPTRFRFFPFHAIELYRMMDWVREAE